MMTAAEDRIIADACRNLPRPRGNYRDYDYVSTVVDTVIDFQLNETITTRAYKHFEDEQWADLRTYGDLCAFMKRFPNTAKGNRRAAKELWGYEYGKRFGQLRALVKFLGRIGATDYPTLRRWAHASDFEQDFEGQVKGLAFAVYKWLVMRLGVETVKPDMWIKRWLQHVTGRAFDDDEAVEALERAAKTTGKKADKLDWAIWDTRAEWSKT
jgi:hypothetical protein